MIDLARTRTDPDDRADFFERTARYRKRGVAIGTNWAEMRIAENAWRRFATAAERAAFRFRVHGGQAQTSVPSNGAPTLYFYRFVLLGELAH